MMKRQLSIVLVALIGGACGSKEAPSKAAPAAAAAEPVAVEVVRVIE
jgi:hypothetical protein